MRSLSRSSDVVKVRICFGLALWLASCRWDVDPSLLAVQWSRLGTLTRAADIVSNGNKQGVFPSVIYCTLPPIQQCRGQKQTSTCRFVQTLRGCRSHDGRSQSRRLSPGTESEGRGSGDQHATSLRLPASLSQETELNSAAASCVESVLTFLAHRPTHRPACIWRRLLSVQSREEGKKKHPGIPRRQTPVQRRC